MKRTIWQACYQYISLEDLDGVERLMSKEELTEMNNKILNITSNLMGIPDVQTRALIEQSLKRGYLAAHVYFTGEEG